MPYAKQTWADGPAGATPVSAARLNHMEDGIEAAGAVAAGVVSASAALSVHTPNSTVMEQWGTEQAVIAQASAPAEAVVIAWLSGSVSPGPGAAIGDRGEYGLEVSFDGGTTWAALGDTATLVTILSTASARRMPVAATGRASGTVTGDVQVRAVCRDLDAANDTTWADGYIVVLVHAA